MRVLLTAHAVVLSLREGGRPDIGTPKICDRERVQH